MRNMFLQRIISVYGLQHMCAYYQTGASNYIFILSIEPCWLSLYLEILYFKQIELHIFIKNIIIKIVTNSVNISKRFFSNSSHQIYLNHAFLCYLFSVKPKKKSKKKKGVRDDLFWPGDRGKLTKRTNSVINREASNSRLFLFTHMCPLHSIPLGPKSRHMSKFHQSLTTTTKLSNSCPSKLIYLSNFLYLDF